MLAFWLGMFAAVLWLVVLVGFGVILKNRTGHPFRTIGRFRRARRIIAPVPQADPAGPVVPAEEPESQPEERATVPRVPARQRGPRQHGGLTYVVVDADGIPEG